MSENERNVTYGGKRERENPSFVSFEISVLGKKEDSVEDDAEFGRWWRKAINDLLKGCSRSDVDPIIREAFDWAKEHMLADRDRKRKYADKKKAEKQEGQKESTAPVGAAVYGSEQNVYLTANQYNELVAIASQYRLRLEDVNNVIEALSCKLKDGTRQSADHFATLKSWLTYRAEKAEERANDPRQETFDEHNRRVYQQACRNLGLTK